MEYQTGEYNLIYGGQNISDIISPRYYDAPEYIIPVAGLKKRAVKPSKMFTIKLELLEFEKKFPGKAIYDASQGDGGLSLGGIPPVELVEALKKYLPEHQSTKYGDPVGRADIRTAILENYYRFDSNSGLTPDNIVIGDGGRDLLQKWYQLLVNNVDGYGDNVLVSAAPWGSYPQGTYINGINVLMAPGEPNHAFKISYDAIDTAIDYSAKDGRKIIGIILTSPDNPTGNYTSHKDLIKLVEYSRRKGIEHIFVDLMYQAITDPTVGRYDLNALYNSLSRQAKQSVVFLDGLTKSVGASNLRNAHLVVGNNRWTKLFKGLATHTVLPNAIGEAAALEVYGCTEPDTHPWIKRVSEPTSLSRKIVRSQLEEWGYKFICDQGYYAFINVWPFLGKKLPAGIYLENGEGGRKGVIENVVDLKSYLSVHCGLAIIHGTVFKQPHFVRFSYANKPDYTKGALNRFHETLTALE